MGIGIQNKAAWPDVFVGVAHPDEPQRREIAIHVKYKESAKVNRRGRTGTF
jgi:hypothetical protein